MTIYCEYCNVAYEEWISFEILTSSYGNKELIELVKGSVFPSYRKQCATSKLKIQKLEKDIKETQSKIRSIQREEKNLKYIVR